MDGWEVGTLESRQVTNWYKWYILPIWSLYLTYHLLPVKVTALRQKWIWGEKMLARCSSDRKSVFKGRDALWSAFLLVTLHIFFSQFTRVTLVVSSVSWETSIRNATSQHVCRNAHRPSNSRNLSLKTHPQQQAVDACNKAPILVTDDKIFEEYSANDLSRSCRCTRCILQCWGEEISLRSESKFHVEQKKFYDWVLVWCFPATQTEWNFENLLNILNLTLGQCKSTREKWCQWDYLRWQVGYFLQDRKGEVFSFLSSSKW